MDDRNAARGQRLRLLRIAWDKTQEQILPGARVAIGHVERGINKCTSARIVGAYTELTGTNLGDFRAYAEGLESLEWLIRRADPRHKPPAGWQRRVYDARLAKSAGSDCTETSDISDRSGAFSSRGKPPSVLPPFSDSEGDEMPWMTETLRRAARAAAIIDAVPDNKALQAAARVMASEEYRDLTDKPAAVLLLVQAIREQMKLASSGEYSRVGNGS